LRRPRLEPACDSRPLEPDCRRLGAAGRRRCRHQRLSRRATPGRSAGQRPVSPGSPHGVSRNSRGARGCRARLPRTAALCAAKSAGDVRRLPQLRTGSVGGAPARLQHTGVSAERPRRFEQPGQVFGRGRRPSQMLRYRAVSGPGGLPRLALRAAVSFPRTLGHGLQARPGGRRRLRMRALWLAMVFGWPVLAQPSAEIPQYRETTPIQVGDELMIAGERFRISYFTTQDPVGTVAEYFFDKWKQMGLPTMVDGHPDKEM